MSISQQNSRTRLAVLALLSLLGGLCLLCAALVNWLTTVVPLPVIGPTATPSPTATPTLTPTATPSATATPIPVTATPAPTATPLSARVSEAGDRLRLRTGPSVRDEIITELPKFTPLSLTGRTADFVWLKAVTPAGQSGWVMSQFVEVFIKVWELPIIATDENYLSGVTSHAREIYLEGQKLGNQARAFSLVGDSNTDTPAFFAPLEYGNYTLGAYAYLQPSIDFFKGSFGRHSPAAVGSFNTSKVLDPKYADGRCQAGETPLVCEYRLQKPSIALILLGTGDQHSWEGFEARYRKIIEYTIEQGIIPVLITKADDLESKENTAAPGFTNGVIERLSGEYDIPLINLRRAVEHLPDHGCIWDGFHYNTPPDGQSANFDTAHLLYGQNMHNLLALQMLDRLRLLVLYDAP